jgi:hypothetical protein
MPFYTNSEGINIFTDDICDGCDHLYSCNVYTDLTLEGRSSQWHEKHIVHPGEEAERHNYVGCKSFKTYIPPAERANPDPGFGMRISQVEANRHDGLPDGEQRPDMR